VGKSAGVVTSVPFSHATPAGFVAHNRVRTDYQGIAYQMLMESRCDLIMGCGNPMFDDNGNPVKGQWKNTGYVGDSIFWVRVMEGSGWQTKFRIGGLEKTVKDIDGDGNPDPWTVIHSRSEFVALQKGKTPKRLLGCPDVFTTLQIGRRETNGETPGTPPFITPLIQTVPTLAEMAGGALNVLDNNPNGFFVMIEGGAIDWAGHGNLRGRLMEEMKDFNDAVNEAVQWVEKNSSWDETMLIVTGDHETGFLWGGEPFTPLKDQGKGKLPVMQFNSKDHTNSLIPLFAKGAGSEYFRSFADELDSVRGSYIQNAEIPQLIHFLWEK